MTRQTVQAAPSTLPPPAGKRRIVTLDSACEYATREYGAFSKSIAYKLMREKKIIGMKHLGRTMVDLDSIDRYFANLSEIELQPRSEAR